MNNRLRAQPVTQVPPKNPQPGDYFGVVFAVCASVLLIMLTIKAGMLLFG